MKNTYSNHLLQKLDRILAIASIFLAALLLIVGFVIARVMLILFGFLFFSCCFLWLIMRKHDFSNISIIDSDKKLKILSIIYFLLFISSILVLYSRPEYYERPFSYFIIIGFISGVIACQAIISNNRSSFFILIQIILLGLNIAWSQLLLFPGLLGIDPWFHQFFSNIIIHTGKIPEGYSYSFLPLFHVVITIASLFFNTNYKFTVMLSVSLVQIVCNCLFIYLIAENLFKNCRISLLSALIVILANFHISNSIKSTPNAFAAIFMPVVFLLIILQWKSNSKNVKYNIVYIYLIFLLFIAIILTHSLTAICMALLLFVAWGSLIFYQQYLSNNQFKMSLIIPVVFTIIMVAWWGYISNYIEIFSLFLKYGFSPDRFVSIPQEFYQYAFSFPIEESLITLFGPFLFFSLAFIGLFYMISRENSPLLFFFACISITPLVLTFFSFIFGMTIIESRWWYFAEIFLSIPLAVSFYMLVTWITKNNNARFICTFILVSSFCLIMIINPSANIHNSSILPISGTTQAYTESEFVASYFFASNTVGKISSNSLYCLPQFNGMLHYYYSIESERLQSLDYSLITGLFYHDDSVKIIRSRIFNETLFIDFPIHIPTETKQIIDGTFNKIYNNQQVTGYL